MRRRELEDQIAIELQRAVEQEERAVAARLEARFCKNRSGHHKSKAEQLQRDLDALDRYEREQGKETA